MPVDMFQAAAEFDEIAAVAGDINRQSTDVVTWAPRTATALASIIIDLQFLSSHLQNGVHM